MSAAIFDLSSPLADARNSSIESDASQRRTWTECSRLSAMSELFSTWLLFGLQFPASENLDLVLPQKRNRVSPVSNSRQINLDGFGDFSTTAEVVDDRLCFHSEESMNVFIDDVKKNSACIHSADDYSSPMAINNKLLKETRNKMGLSQSDIGRKIGRDSSTINKMEDGQTKSMDAETLLKLSNALHLNPFDIMSMRQATQVRQDSPAQEAADIIEHLSPTARQQAIHHLRVFREADAISGNALSADAVNDDLESGRPIP